MALVNARRQRNLALGGAAAVVDSLVANRQLIRALANRVAALADSAPTTRRPPKAKGKRTGGKQEINKGGPSMTMMYKSVKGGSISTVTVNDKFLDTIVNTSANQASNYLVASLYNQSGSSASTFAALSTKLSNFRGLYRHYRINWIKMTWIPSVTDQIATGNFMIRFDNDPTAEVNSTTATRYMVADTHILTPICKGATTTWRPSEAKEREERYCQLISGTTRSADELAFGVIQYYAPNNLAISTQLGYVAYDVSVTYSNPIA